jgi:hypothetical protein
MNDIKVVPSRLYTAASQKVEKQVEKELEIPDPDFEDAMAALEEAEEEEAEKQDVSS